MATTVLKNISEIRRYFHRNEDPVYFVSATNFNLLGIDEWVKNFKYICYIDCYDGRHPNVFCPSEQPHAEFQSIEDINNYLLQHKEVIDYIKRRGGKPKFVFLMFDEETERLAKELGSRVVTICNVVGSTMTREADGTIYTHAGPEIGVASTKAFTTQITILTMLALKLAKEKGLSQTPVSMRSLRKSREYRPRWKKCWSPTPSLKLSRMCIRMPPISCIWEGGIIFP